MNLLFLLIADLQLKFQWNLERFQRDQFAFIFLFESILPPKIMIIKIDTPPQIYFQPPPNIPSDASMNPQSVIAIIGTETIKYLKKGILSKPRI